MFVTAEDFNLKPYNIPNLQLVANTFPLYIEEEERKILLRLLGSALYYEFVTGLDGLPLDWKVDTSYSIGDETVYGVSVWVALTDNVGVIPTEGLNWNRVRVDKWLQLERGSPYNYYNEGHVWAGMKKMLTPYIYQKWLEDSFDSFSGIGITEAKAENANILTPAARIVRAHNEFALMAGTFDVVSLSSDYYDFFGDYGSNSMAGFLNSANASEANTYNNWRFDDPGLKNAWGL